jgi:hypothetical protein
VIINHQSADKTQERGKFGWMGRWTPIQTRANGKLTVKTPIQARVTENLPETITNNAGGKQSS